MAPSTRFELTTFRLGGGRSILLSYEGLCCRRFGRLHGEGAYSMKSRIDPALRKLYWMRSPKLEYEKFSPRPLPNTELLT